MTEVIDTQLIRDQICFDKYSLQLHDLTVEEIDMVLTFPVDTECLVQRKVVCRSSAYSQMKEQALIAGFMRGAKDEIQVLVVYLERPDEDSFEYGLVDFSQLKPLPRKD